MLRRCLAAAVLASALLPASALGAATVEVDQNISLIRITGDAAVDRINIQQRANDYLITSSNNGLAPAGNLCADEVAGSRITCPHRLSLNIDLGGEDDTLTVTALSHPISAFGGDGNDTLTGGTGTDVLAGGNGADTLDGREGVDDYFGQDGNDTIEALDGNAERMSCGADTDLVRNDFTDIIAECEGAEDGDGDSFSSGGRLQRRSSRRSSPARARRWRTASTRTATVATTSSSTATATASRSRPTATTPSAAIRPGALEVKGNTVDENCDSRAEPFALLRALVLNNWQVDGRRTKLRLLQVRNAPQGARIVFRCTGAQLPVAAPADARPCRVTWRRSGWTTAGFGAPRCVPGRS